MSRRDLSRSTRATYQGSVRLRHSIVQLESKLFTFDSLASDDVVVQLVGTLRWSSVTLLVDNTTGTLANSSCCLSEGQKKCHIESCGFGLGGFGSGEVDV